VRILFIFNAERITHSCSKRGPYPKFISFTFDYGMRCGLLARPNDLRRRDPPYEMDVASNGTGLGKVLNQYA
jgi:hypothetical protein